MQKLAIALVLCISSSLHAGPKEKDSNLTVVNMSGESLWLKLVHPDAHAEKTMALENIGDVSERRSGCA